MEIIPVLDLMDGSVVRARVGQRASYRPIETPLCPGSDPLDVGRALLRVAEADRLYVADLDAIERKGNHLSVLERLKSELEVDLWVDAGIADYAAARNWLAADIGSLVLGSEAQTDTGLVKRLRDDDRVLLSLDFRGDAFLGPSALLSKPGAWPDRVIVMSLMQVGSAAGPDFARIAATRALGGSKRLYAAGGIRSVRDLLALARLEVAGALVASCLHDGTLTANDVAGLRSTGTRDRAG